MKWEMTWVDLHILSVLTKFSLNIFYGFSLFAFLRYIFLKVIYINKYFADKTHSFNIFLNYIIIYKNEIIIILCMVLTFIILLNFKTFKIKFNLANTITIFIYLFGVLILCIKIFF
jgi:hypothetical protein